MVITSFHAKYYANRLLLKKSYNDDSRLSSSLFDSALTINPHQVNAALFAFNSPLSKGALLADEVGLGKTIEAGIVLCQMWAENKRKLLVICPASLRKQWSIELNEKFNLPSMILDSRMYKKYIKENGRSPLLQNNIFIMSYNYAASISNELNRVLWDMAVFDEAHKLKNSYRSSNRLGQTLIPALKDIYKVLLTATPMQNNLSELYGLAAVIDEHIFGDIKIFRSDYISNDNNFEELKYRLRQFCTRTLRKDVTEYIKYTSRYPIVFKFSPSDLEQELYNNISTFLQRDDTYSVPVAQKHIVTLVVRKVLASSTTAVIGTLQAILKRLETMRINAVENQYEFDKSVTSYFISDDDDDMLALMDEYMDDYVDEDGYGGTEEKRVDIYKLDKEIEEINGFIDTASCIETDTKAKTLLEALENGFKHTVELGGNKKALIFTESIRTQKFLKEYLENNGYTGRLVIFNGGGQGAEITAIYNEWLERNRYSGRCSGSVTADKRNAIIEYFRDNADIMIATESAAEGVNLQFCSLVINYDLPWNPQRIEQRIGRCHRYGQKNDVVVINFVNNKNDVDRRVYDLLDQKFNLFTGVFGSSDEVLGAVESGIDFEKSILSIYQKCRTPQDIEHHFNELQRSMEDVINKNIRKAHEDLFKNFDMEVHERLKLSMDEFLDKFSRHFWLLTGFILNGKAEFNNDNHRFYLKNDIDNIQRGKYYLVSKNKEAVDGVLYRTNHPLGEYVIRNALSISNKHGKVTFNISDHKGYKISLVEGLKQRKGYLSLYKYTVKSFDKEEYLLFSGMLDNGETITQEQCEKLFECGGVEREFIIDSNIIDKLKAYVHVSAEQKRAESERNNAEYFQREEVRLEKWSQDMVARLEMELKNIKQLIRDKERTALNSMSLDEKYELNKEIQILSTKKRKMRMELDENEEAIYAERARLIDDIKKRMVSDTYLEEIYTIAWEVI